MKHFFLFFSLLGAGISLAQEIIRPEKHGKFVASIVVADSTDDGELVKVIYSKPFAILKFMETTKGGSGISGTFRKQIDTSAILQKEEFLQLKLLYQRLRLDYNYTKQDYPEKRKHTTSTWDLICVAAISSKTNQEFFSRIIGILPNDDYLKLKQVISGSEAYYDAFMYNSQHEAIQTKVIELRKHALNLNQLFEQFRVFYGSSWDKSVPFNLTIYPIFGKRGQTTATPHANSLEMGFLLESKDTYGMLGIGVHEMCHVLFEEQPLALQKKIDSVFSASKDPYAAFAYRYIDEALATALGNGYAYQYLSTKIDTGSWYSDAYINGYAKALYPLVEEYLKAGKQMDENFVLKAITLFKQTFPDALYDISALMMQSDAYFEDDEESIVDPIINSLHSEFRIYMSNTSIPIDDPVSLQNIKTSEQTQLFIIYKNQAKNLKLLKSLFPELKKLPKKENMLAGFLDQNKRPVMLIVAENAAKANEGILLLKKKGKIDPKQLWQGF